MTQKLHFDLIIFVFRIISWLNKQIAYFINPNSPNIICFQLGKNLHIPSNSVLWLGILSKVGGRINIGIDDGVITLGSLCVYDLALLYRINIRHIGHRKSAVRKFSHLMSFTRPRTCLEKLAKPKKCMKSSKPQIPLTNSESKK
ncbi:hypothetical protein BpHYR1_048104 [Brachionus plicatilis]|uniref:Uncharacterized protein n=1 Tax=Brachionus plicatilis TaxID=10195 RepID=A0A3M7R713_BRAPC|nr:hypothetical protein BpHYR1_048104 [Brachionus plicatilis]